ncbi:sigma-70 family RNA polymerase sigma factor [Micavibrio aeruginosavorus]|uniref:RNA polymerase, sigma-24 subunit, ECF subfamily n=1 Tax=Micavibrio aeruginosavorus EPB TaxID=349215 RepID=M4VLI1_9BACT|nr:sigma-70 family RNA polymerase sigma factor [Micavibrio aeruginosavorus]AGH98966.1 RNA polymerase, sigma-24 subunit, ECF subfamily [Micavibrio aeruginosavorus EPB]
MAKNSYSGVDSYAAFFIAYRAKTLTRMPIFTKDDYEDIQQELMLAYLHAWPDFDPAKGDRRSFIKTVVNLNALRLIRDTERQKRWTGLQMVSLSSPAGAEDGQLTLGDTLDQEDGLWGDVFLGQSQRVAEQQMDIRRMLAAMPGDLRETYRILSDYGVSEAAALLGIPRTTMSSRLKRLRKFIEDFMNQK